MTVQNKPQLIRVNFDEKHNHQNQNQILSKQDTTEVVEVFSLLLKWSFEAANSKNQEIES